MAPQPYFSVIIPCLNEEKYLPKLLSSLAKQAYRNFEVILVDGKSEDGTVAVFEKFRPKLPAAHVIDSSKRSVGYQRNLGAQKSRGKFLVFLDADVDVTLTFLAELHLAAIKKHFILATTWITPDSNNPADKLMLLLGNLGQELAKGINQPYAGGYNTIIDKKAFLKLGGFREDLKINEDHDLAIRARKMGIDTVILKEPQVIYSLRRFRSQGRLHVVRKLAEGEIRHFLHGPITSELFDYPMGGHVHKSRKKKIVDFTKIDTYIKSIDTLERKVVKLLTE